MSEEHREEEWFVLELDPFEESHFRSVPAEYVDLLLLTKNGTLICTDLAVEGCQQVAVRKGVYALLAFKAADHLRLATNGLLLGYYHSVPVLLRVALDSIGALLLVTRSASQFRRWALISHPDIESLTTDVDGVDRLRRQFTGAARSAYNRLVSEDPHVRPVSDLVTKFNSHVHPGVVGLLEHAGLSASLEEVLDEAVSEAFQNAEGDILQALKLLELKAKHSPGRSRRRDVDDEKGALGPGILQPALLDEYAQVVHSATHHLYDIAEYLFGKSLPRESAQRNDAWHNWSLSVFSQLAED